MATYGSEKSDRDITELKVEVAVVSEQIKGIRAEIDKVNKKLDKLTESAVDSKVKIAILSVIGIMSGAGGSILLRLLGS